MNPIVKLILDSLYKYVQEHPEEVQKIINYGLDLLVKWVESQRK